MRLELTLFLDVPEDVTAIEARDVAGRAVAFVGGRLEASEGRYTWSLPELETAGGAGPFSPVRHAAGES